MVHPKLRRVLAFAFLLSALSLLPAQAASFGSRMSRGESLFARIEHWQHLAWNFLFGGFEKQRSEINPDGVRTTTTDGGHSGH